MPKIYQVWLFDDMKDRPAQQEQVADHVTQRLVTMPMVAPRQLANAMMPSDFWQTFAQLP